MGLTQVCVLLVIAPLTVVSQRHLRDPCGEWEAKGICNNGKEECRLVQSYCPRNGRPCPPPEPRCVPIRLKVSSCRYGHPVLDSNYRPLSCYRGNPCPQHTTCNTEVMDTQSTCCWVPQLPPTPPPRPRPPTFNPCAARSCPYGQICEVRPPTDCYRRRCRPVAVCVDSPPDGFNPCAAILCQVGQTCEVRRVCFKGSCRREGVCVDLPPAPPAPEDPCATVLCERGYRCEGRATPCLPPGPCPLKGVCVRDPSVINGRPGVCPFVTGPCDNGCEEDYDCDANQKCCKHACGTVCATPLPSNPSGDPCLKKKCGRGLECRLREECSRPSCSLTPVCVPETPKPRERRCTIGFPVLDENSNAIFCGRGPGSRSCPDNTFCKIHPLDIYAVCCHQAGTPTPPVTPDPNPCKDKVCGRDEVCRVETIFCVTQPCPEPKAVCRPINKPGSCPVDTNPLRPCNRRFVCSIDGDCPGTQKCCDKCRRCVEPAPPLPKTGKCPAPVNGPPFFGPCIAKCSFDSQCPGNQLCCGNCPRECVNPVPEVPTPPTKPVEKPGNCPAPVDGLVGICIARCSFDSECPGNQKCCGNCPRECVNPVPEVPTPPTKPVEKPGNCPAPVDGLVGICIARCSFDSECPGNQKCCGNCPRECVNPVPEVPTPPTKPVEKPGNCPAPVDGLVGICIARCSFDSECPGNQKCCGNCPRECVNPVPEVPTPPTKPVEKPGNCPAPVDGLVGICIARCSFDSECPGNQKCCGNCPRECVNPVPEVPTPPTKPVEKPGNCPAPVDGLVGICIARCSFDSECPGNQKCCGGCPRECVNPVPEVPTPPTKPVEKPGNCPAPVNGLAGICIARCSFDSECPGNQKCCGSCPRECVNPVYRGGNKPKPVVKKGSCPSSKGLIGICVELCSGDSTCPGTQKCCSNGCGHTCQEPVTTYLPPPRPVVYVDSDPCKRQVCNSNQVCRLKEVNCIRSPCPPVPECVPRSSVGTSSVCRSGYPVIDTSQNTISCTKFQPRRSCPDNTVCTKGVCCWDAYVPVPPPRPTRPPVKPGRCPKVNIFFSFIYCTFTPSCQTDSQCEGVEKCCSSGQCGRRCMHPLA